MDVYLNFNELNLFGTIVYLGWQGEM